MSEGTNKEKSTTTSAEEKRKEDLKHLFAGGVAGAVSRTAVSPLERLKILYQVQRTQKLSIYETLVKIGKEEGIMGYFKGNGTNIIRIFPYSAVQFASYERFKKLLTEDGKPFTPSKRFIAGAFAGIASVVSTYPLDLIRTRLSVPSYTQLQYTGITNAFVVIVKNEGIFALYKGIVPTIAGIAPYIGLNFMAYGTLKEFYTQHFGEPNTVALLCCGGISGALAQTITYPLDVLRRIMQVQGYGEHPTYRTSRTALFATIKEHGLMGLYKGLVPNYLKVVPSVAISFVTYEYTKEALKKF